MTDELVNTVTQFCQKHNLLAQGDHVVIGVSGGPDSLCLWRVLMQLKPIFNLRLTVAHLNHQIRGDEARADAQFVQNLAAHWQIPCQIESIDVAAVAQRRKQSLEEAARQIRYAFLWRVAAIEGATKIAVGHNADDQVETVLMHFLRGAGLSGLRGMLPQTGLADLRLHPDDLPPVDSPSPHLIRPLLEVWRADIEAYCQAHHLKPRQDYSNQDTTFFRNRLRHELLPYLETYNPNIRKVLHHTAQVIAADYQVLAEQVKQSWRQVVIQETDDLVQFRLSAWLDLPLAMQRSTLRRAVQLLRRGLRNINFEHIETAIEIIRRRETGMQATLPQGLRLIVGYNTITLTGQPEKLSPPTSIPRLTDRRPLPVNLPGITSLPDTGWRLRAEILSPTELSRDRLTHVKRWEAFLDADAVGPAPLLRPRQPGDTFCPLGLKGRHKKINEFMIDEKIPDGWRDVIPLLVNQQHILWICGYRPDERARVRSDTRQVVHMKFEPAA